jgi:type II pantothenate kinase
LDLGISSTDAVVEGDLARRVSLPTGDPTETAEEALRRVLYGDSTDGIAVAATGVGCRSVGSRIAGLPVWRVPEIEAIGRGGTTVAGTDEALVVSLGTGTALVSVRREGIRHVLPGTGIGGGTLLAFARRIGRFEDIESFLECARRGDRSRVDLLVGAIAGGPLGDLPPGATASNLAGWTAESRPEDVAAALVGLVADVVLTVTLLGLRASGHHRAVLVGRLARLEAVQARIAALPGDLPRRLVVPPEAEVATAFGAIVAARASESGA